MEKGKARVAGRGARRAPTRRRGRGPAAVAEPSALLRALKGSGPLTLRDLARQLDVTYEAVRQQVTELTRAGWVVPSGERTTPRVASSSARKPGPASQRYCVSAAAEQLFPKHYDELSAELVQQVRECFGGAGVSQVLARMTEARVRQWAPRLEGLTLREKLKALSALYADKDAYMELEWRADGPALIERNCPFLNVAQKHPAICSVSINTLERLLGCKVVRERRFQAGDGRCVFRLRVDEPRPRDAAFALEK